MLKKVLFIDRDGTIIKEPEDQQIDSFDKLEFLPFAISSLSKIAAELDYELVMVTNQDGLGTASFPETDFYPVHNKMLSILQSENVRFTDIHIDRSFETDQLPTRKPCTGMLQAYLYGKYDLAQSYVIGDRKTDIQLAKNLGTGAILIASEKDEDAQLSTENWQKIYQFLKEKPRCATIQRKTLETNVSVTINLDGAGRTNIDTGLPFFDHMLEQIARHGQLDLDIRVAGDLQVDEHHSIEDTAIALGAACHQAIGSKKGITRYGFLLPMDDCLAQVALDFGGRSWLVWDATFNREKIGDMPTEMFVHFFKSFSDHAGCNLNIQADGTNEHHKIESIFKAFARALQMAVSKTNTNTIPSTKGNL